MKLNDAIIGYSNTEEMNRMLVAEQRYRNEQERQRLEQEAEEYGQVSNWLQELKKYRETPRIVYPFSDDAARRIKKNSEKLLQLVDLVSQNPELRILPMVDSEIVADDGNFRWMGQWGDSRIDEIAFHHERVYFKGWDDEYDLFCIFYDENELLEKFGNGKLTEEQEKAEDEYISKKLKEIKWEKVIVVNIDLPE